MWINQVLFGFLAIGMLPNSVFSQEQGDFESFNETNIVLHRTRRALPTDTDDVVLAMTLDAFKTWVLDQFKGVYAFQSGNLIFEQLKERPECFKYLMLDDETRKSSYSDRTGFYCDSLTPRGVSSSTSPDWKGQAWYRFSDSIGSMLASSSPGKYQCNTHGTGYLAFPYSVDVGERKTVVVCYDTQSGKCQGPKEIEMTNCGGFFVYNLQDFGCSMRYCSSG